MGGMGLHILYRLYYSIPYVYHTSIPHIRIPPSSSQKNSADKAPAIKDSAESRSTHARISTKRRNGPPARHYFAQTVR